MKVKDYLFRAIDFIPFASIAKGIYYIRISREKEHKVEKIFQDVNQQFLRGDHTAEEAKALKEYTKIHQMKAKAIRERGILVCIPILGNLLIAIHDIRGRSIPGGYLDSMKSLSEWNM